MGKVASSYGVASVARPPKTGAIVHALGDFPAPPPPGPTINLTGPLLLLHPPTMDLVCFTNCFLPQDDGELVRRDLWIDAKAGTILDAQVRLLLLLLSRMPKLTPPAAHLLCCPSAPRSYH